MRPFEVPGGLDVGRAGAARDSDGESLASRPDHQVCWAQRTCSLALESQCLSQQAPAGATRTGWAGRSPTPSLAHSLVPQAHRKHLLRAGPWAGGAACLMANGHVSDSARGGRLGDRGRRGRTRARTAGRPGCRGLRAFGGQGRLPPPPWKGTRSCSGAGQCPCRDREARSRSSPSRGGPGPPQPQPRAPGLAASTAERGGFQAGRTLPSRARRDVGGPVTPHQPTSSYRGPVLPLSQPPVCPPMTRPSGLTF